MPGILRTSSRRSDSSGGSIPGYYTLPSRQNSLKFRDPGATFTPPSIAPGLPGPTPYRHLQGVPMSLYAPPLPPSPPYAPYTHTVYPGTAPPAPGIRSVPVVVAAAAPTPQLPRLNPLIEASKLPILDFDVKYHPSTIITSPNLRSGSGSFYPRFDEPATTPPVPYMKLVSPYLGSKWAIRIQASPGRFVTVNDVLYAIYKDVNLAIAKADIDVLSLRDQEKVVKAYGKRCNSIKDPKAASRERASGVRRVDFLNGRTSFVGLSPSEYGPTVWSLHLK
ncbi:hypothetical protein BDN72DRAFT_856702 [Pluteus cervinus]|uniref:Uncharacterized protein n=1 Tax=Pluteus cervinus TaxID=181527 RepID=A0ACD3AXL5_9AGAR|nr:hypothetical protein BDN72DRAFT_856702 [Pluteus cervinus]